MGAAVGQPAPDFEAPLADVDEETGRWRVVRLSEALARGPLILHFFPAPFTST